MTDIKTLKLGQLFTISAMKKYIVLLASALFVACTAQQEMQNDLKDLDLRGDVKFINIEQYEGKSAFGKVVETNLVSHVAASFDENGYLIEMLTQDKGEIATRMQYQRDSDNKKVTCSVFTDSLIGKMLVRYNDYYQPIDESYYDADGKQKGREVYTYTNEGQLTEYFKYGTSGDVRTHYANYVYEKGLLMRYNRVSESGKCVSSYSYRYDDRNQKIREVVEDGDGSLDEVTFWEYNDKGDCTKITVDRTYSKQEIEYRYEYDSRGNYTRKETITSYNGRVIYEVEKRNIDYYSSDGNEGVSTTLASSHEADDNASYKILDPKPIKYLIRFVNYDGSLLDTISVEKGKIPQYAGKTPSRQELRTTTYEFSGWEPGLKPADANSTYTATFVKKERKIDSPKVAAVKNERKPESPKAIDLGLPSGLKWANMNVEARWPEDSGGFYAWGETFQKTSYSLNTYMWYDKDSGLIKYNHLKSKGLVDNKTVLELSDDVAHEKWGGYWRMPTLDDWNELQDKCTWTFTTLNGVKGCKVTGPNGNHIFFPASGYYDGTKIISKGYTCLYWGPSLRKDDPYLALTIYFDSPYITRDTISRYYGLNIRPVISSTKKRRGPGLKLSGEAIDALASEEAKNSAPTFGLQ